MRKVPKLLLVGIIALTGLWAGTTRARAVDEGVAASLATAPSGLNQLDKLFTLPSVFSSGVANSAQIADVTNSSSPNTQAVEVITNKKQVGGFWSNDSSSINLNEDTTLKMWLYLGTQSSASKAGDGMAFVMQNDPNGTSAAAQISAKNIVGETLGTWGVDADSKEKDPQVIADSAIQNSWALEFDTYANNSSSSGSGFDGSSKNQHIATGYPADASTYTSKSSGLILTSYYFIQNHNNMQSVSLGNGQWHHLVMKWDAASKTMTYTLDDINADGSTNAAPITNSEVIDTSKFNSANGMVRWGFMGATGSNSTSNMVVIESVPNLVSAEAKVTVTDTTKNKVITDGVKVKANHDLKYDYTLNYTGGQQDWDNVEADLKLPEHVTFSGATVRYADGSEEQLSAPEKGAKEVSYKLGKALGTSNATATITLTGKADDVEINGNTTTTTSTFKNKVFETTADAPDYTITVDQEINLYYLTAGYTVAKGDDVTVKGLVIAEDSEQLKNSSITIHPTLNGKEMEPFQMSDDDESARFFYPIKADQLNVGKNYLTLWASDMDDNESEEESIVITVQSGELGFKTVASVSTFKPITLDGHAQTASRAGDWNVVVSDERQKGSSWQLQAKVSDFTNSAGRKLPGEVLFKRDGQTTTLTDQGTPIDSRTTTSDTDEYSVTDQWTDDSGIFYKSNAAATPGKYSGKITWTLTDAPK